MCPGEMATMNAGRYWVAHQVTDLTAVDSLEGAGVLAAVKEGACARACGPSLTCTARPARKGRQIGAVE